MQGPFILFLVHINRHHRQLLRNDDKRSVIFGTARTRIILHVQQSLHWAKQIVQLNRNVKSDHLGQERAESTTKLPHPRFINTFRIWIRPISTWILVSIYFDGFLLFTFGYWTDKCCINRFYKRLFKQNKNHLNMKNNSSQCSQTNQAFYVPWVCRSKPRGIIEFL